MSNYTNISYNSNSLQTSNIFVSKIDHFGIPGNSLSLQTVDHENKSVIPFLSYPNRKIMVEGIITGSSIADLDSRLDTFRSYFTGQDQNLDIDYNGTTRRYIATLDTANSSIDRPGGLLYAEFKLSFVCTSPWGQATSTNTLLNVTGRTSASYNDNITVLGTAPYQLPIFTFTLTAVTGGTTQPVYISNNTNGQGITVTRTWANGDVLVIDTTLKTVTINGTTNSFIGAFPEFAPGAQNIGYTDGFTTRTFSLNVIQTALYY